MRISEVIEKPLGVIVRRTLGSAADNADPDKADGWTGMTAEETDRQKREIESFLRSRGRISRPPTRSPARLA